MDVFKKPSAIPQDLLLIQDFVDILPTQPQDKPATNDDIDSSASESEDEVEADLLNPVDDDETMPPAKSVSPSSKSDSDTDDSDSDEEMGKADATSQNPPAAVDDDEGDDEAGATSHANYLATKNEAEPAVSVPDIEAVGADEVLELVGEIVNIMDQVVIVRGQESDIAGRGSDKALDSGTLLVFEDRTVLGHIYDTFGPTNQPLYQIKFTKTYPVQPERVYVDRKVFHVPQRSHFVFLSQIKQFKGSDASNVHDEEPADDELEFSDDEAEAAHNRSLKQKRAGSRAASSRQSTPSYRPQFSANPYDAFGPYDDNFSAGPSRPAPTPYDDPYSEEYTSTTLRYDTPPPEGEAPSTNSASKPDSMTDSVPADRPKDPTSAQRGKRGGRGGQRERAPSHNHRQGGGRQRKQNGRPRNSGGDGNPQHWRGESSDWMPTDRHMSGPSEGAAVEPSRPLSPTSLAIARATGQYTNDSPSAYSPNQGWNPGLQGQMPGSAVQGLPYQAGGHGRMPMSQSEFSFYPPQQMQPHAGSYVQPHINPRFASALGFNFSQFDHSGGMSYPPQSGMSQYEYGQNQQMMPSSGYESHAMSSSGHNADWTDEWTVPVTSKQGNQGP